jgi:putative DNA primase/helicase
LKPNYPGGGSRHEGALVLGGVLARAAWDQADIEHLVEVLARNAGDDDVRDRIVAATSALDAKANGHDIAGLPRLAELWGDDTAKVLGRWLNVRRPGSGKGAGLEDSVALEFAAQHTDDFRYIAKTGQWMGWSTTRWQAEDTLSAFDHARALCRVAGDADAKVVAAVERLARSDRRIAATVEQWDCDPYLLNCGAVTINLKTGDERPPNRLDYCIKQTSIAPAPPGTPCDMWLKFLDRVTGKNDELIAFLQRYLGYCLTGHVYEHVFAFFYGTGANGKSTLINTVSAIFADYCNTSPIEMFLQSKYDRHPTEKARLHKVRLTVAHETPRGRSWDEAKIKDLTGGDPIEARYMRGNFFEYRPTHKIIITGNNKPALRDVDEAMRRRLLLIHFAVQIPPRERDPLLAEKLKAEHPAILRWIIEGCLDWQSRGLGIPDTVRDASEQYFADQDVIAQWLADCVNPDPMAFTSSRSLFKSWSRWCEERKMTSGTEKAFVDTLAKRYEHKRMKSGAGFKGIALKDSGETQVEAELEV